MDHIRIDNLHYSVAGKEILKGVSLDLGGHEFVGLIGPNGCGKSTLLKHIYRVNPIQTGQIFLDGQPLGDIPLRESARKIAVMGQFTRMDFDFTVFQIALMGRTPYKKSFQEDTEEDYAKVQSALEGVYVAGERPVFYNLIWGRTTTGPPSPSPGARTRVFGPR